MRLELSASLKRVTMLEYASEMWASTSWASSIQSGHTKARHLLAPDSEETVTWTERKKV